MISMILCVYMWYVCIIYAYMCICIMYVLYARYVYVFFARPLFIACSDVYIDLFFVARCIVFRRLNSTVLHLNIQSVPRSKHTPSQLQNQSVNAV
jgi:hypothetical protein